ncbi:MAG: hypothetical protein JSU91_02265 [Thermoplasmatales archaeon]|nr:MAG: hypothetical protein JSU91_02265 [Thermoplasmatales archaeon]
MNKVILSIGFLIILIITFFSGCQQQGTITDNNLNNVILESDLVKLVYSIINFNKDDQNEVFSVEVQFRFRNIANRNIEIKVFAEFYDIKDNLLAKEGPKEIYIPEGWTEQGTSPANIITYYGEDAADVDYVKIIVEE